MSINVSADSSEAEVGLSSALTLFLAVGLSFVMVMALCFNGLLCLVFYKRTVLLNASNSFVLNLAACQIGICILVLPLSIVSIISRKWLLSENWCRFQGFLFTVFVLTSMSCVAVISVDRHYAITNSLRYPYVFTQFRCNIIISAGWIAGVCLALPPLIYDDLYGYDMIQFRCGVRWNWKGYETVYLVVVVALCYVLPMFIMLWCYCSIFVAAMRHARSTCRVHPGRSISSSSVSSIASFRRPIKHTTPSNGQLCSQYQTKCRTRRLDCKATRTIFVILMAYFMCWLPYVSVCIMHLSGKGVSDTYEIISVFLLFSSTCVNPVIYGFMNRAIREELLKYLSQILRREGIEDIRGSEDSRSHTQTTSLNSGWRSRRSSDIWSITSHTRRLNLRNCGQSSCMERISEEVPQEDSKQAIPNALIHQNGKIIGDNSVPSRLDIEDTFITPPGQNV